MTKEQEKVIGAIQEKFLPVLQRTFGENLHSVVLYGSVVSDRYTDRVSDANVLILLSISDPAAVARLGSTSWRVIRRYRINPLLLTTEEFENSADVFPMEYLDMKMKRQVIFGEDAVEGLSVTAANLRHQVEEQLRGSIAAFRRALLASRGKPRVMRRYLHDLFGSQHALYRGMLRLKGVDEPSHSPEKMIAEVGARFTVETAPLVDWLKLRGGEKLDAQDIATRSLSLLVELSRIVDRMETATGGADG